MYRAGLDDTPYPSSSSGAMRDVSREGASNFAREEEQRIVGGTGADRSAGPRRTPRKSLIVVLPDNHVVSPEVLAEGLPQTDDHELVDVIVACAGQPASLVALTRRIRDVQVLLAPAGTSPEDLRELAIRHSPGDIVTLLSGAVLPPLTRELEMFTTV